MCSQILGLENLTWGVRERSRSVGLARGDRVSKSKNISIGHNALSVDVTLCNDRFAVRLRVYFKPWGIRWNNYWVWRLSLFARMSQWETLRPEGS